MSFNRTVINTFKHAPMVDEDTWWLDLDRAAFTAMRLKREPTLKARYGCAPITVSGSMEPDRMEQAKRRRSEAA